jgi:hypothetical protein
MGADVTAEALDALVPSKDTVVLVYCTNSLMQTRMVSLTDVVVPQIYALGYENVYMLEVASKHAAPYAGDEELLKSTLNIVSR